MTVCSGGRSGDEASKHAPADKGAGLLAVGTQRSPRVKVHRAQAEPTLTQEENIIENNVSEGGGSPPGGHSEKNQKPTEVSLPSLKLL